MTSLKWDIDYDEYDNVMYCAYCGVYEEMFEFVICSVLENDHKRYKICKSSEELLTHDCKNKTFKSVAQAQKYCEKINRYHYQSIKRDTKTRGDNRWT